MTGDVVVDYYPAVVDADLHRRALAAMAERSRKFTGRGRRLVNLFSGLAVCGNCGNKMTFRGKGRKQRADGTWVNEDYLLRRLPEARAAPTTSTTTMRRGKRGYSIPSSSRPSRRTVPFLSPRSGSGSRSHDWSGPGISPSRGRTMRYALRKPAAPKLKSSGRICAECDVANDALDDAQSRCLSPPIRRVWRNSGRGWNACAPIWTMKTKR